jgi:hypothetical protein
MRVIIRVESTNSDTFVHNVKGEDKCKDTLNDNVIKSWKNSKEG